MAWSSIDDVNAAFVNNNYFHFETRFLPVVTGQTNVNFYSSNATPRAATNAACDRNTANGIFEGQEGISCAGTTFRIAGMDLWAYDRQAPVDVHNQWGALLMVDRLVETTGLAGNSTALQTTNLPTAALTRYTTGAGVQIALEVHALIGSSATTASVSYTNQAGTSGRTSATVGIGGGSYGRRVGNIIKVPLQQGDTGVRSVQSVQLAATTGTLGNIGVTLYKPLLCLPPLDFLQCGRDSYANSFRLWPRTGIPIYRDACLQFFGHLNFDVACGLRGNFYITEA